MSNTKLFDIVLGDNNKKHFYTCHAGDDFVYFWDCSREWREMPMVKDDDGDYIFGIKDFIRVEMLRYAMSIKNVEDVGKISIVFQDSDLRTQITLTHFIDTDLYDFAERAENLIRAYIENFSRLNCFT